MGRTTPKLACALWVVLGVGCAALNIVGERGDGGGLDGGTPSASRVDECGNGLDDDGNGRIDDGCPCGAGEMQACFAGAISSRGIGECSDGVQTCIGGVEWGDWGDAPCVGGTLPSAEQCDGLDHDCDGARDEDCACTAGMSTACLLEFDTQPCRPGTQTCRADATWSECEGAIGPLPDVCDGVDNDCDGTRDEGCGCRPEPERCRDGIDNDCDGAIDEPACTPDWSPDAGIPPGECVPSLAPPRLIAPLSTSRVTSHRPPLRWQLPAGADGARVDICFDRACTDIVTTFDVIGERGVPPVDLAAHGGTPTALAYYWRARSMSGGRVACDAAGTTPTWELFVRWRSAPVASAWSSIPDFNGDGFSDMALADGADRVLVYDGAGLRPLPTTPSLTIPAMGAEIVVATAGDLDGDGFTDLAVSAATPLLRVYRGGPTGLGATPVVIAPRPRGSSSSGSSVASGGDLNGDGYADLVVGYGNELYVFYGSASGVPSSPSTTIVGEAGAGAFVTMIGDVNGDGLTDLFSGEPLAESTIGWIYYGAASGLPPTPSLTLPAGVGSDEHVRPIGDVDGDGYADVMTSYRRAIFHGSAAGLPTTPTAVLPTPSADGVTFWDTGLVFAGAGDVNADGFDDVAFTTNDDQGVPRSGVYYGTAAGLSTAPGDILPTPTVLVTGESWSSMDGSLRAVGDVDGTGGYELVHSLEAWDCTAVCTPTNWFRLVYLAVGGLTNPDFPPPAGSRFVTQHTVRRTGAGI
jgi:hypothetical protein